MSTQPISPTGAGAAGAATRPTGDNATISKDQWLRLLIAQLKAQDPLSPLDPKDFMQQISTLEQTERMLQLQQDFNKFMEASTIDGGSALLGRTVSFTDLKTGEQRSGVVKAAVFEGGRITLRLEDGTLLSPTDVDEVSI